MAKDFWLKDKTTGYYYDIREGTGDALEQEDIDDGYVDYIYYDYYASLTDIKEDNAYDGGMILLKRLYKDLDDEDIIKKVVEFEDLKREDLEILQ